MVSSAPKSSDHDVGIIMTPEEIQKVLELDTFDYSDYLIALLRLTETMVEFTTNSIIRISISEGLKTPAGKIPYSVSLLNLKLLTKLQNGFQMLDLKNDNVRRKYDGLKYNVKKVNGVVYDLSLRKLIVKDIDVV
ncbi:Translin [Suhomyces tanzawaensis NRRL Y-17324]|uniref:Translin n=1 Tax=Suhomyces tanzawaensis NRRL Y-17324 TaxID=984487 RepID=A0A1E4SMS4_9ASCO|nr:Translin [Suhomyces tanzawaensis NRRL Y-17324]ODV80717.1 Translin [Suhomyces tanzawaensis NRRL Y-17324]